jgi:hypothetical protein
MRRSRELLRLEVVLHGGPDLAVQLEAVPREVRESSEPIVAAVEADRHERTVDFRELGVK